VLRTAGKEVRRTGGFVTPEHLLLGLLADEGIAGELLRGRGVRGESVRAYLRS
jgi:hypothetical protein